MRPAPAAPGRDQAGLLTALSKVAPAFGRGESLVVDGLPLELVLVKNPSGFRLGLKSFPAAGYATMIAINDNYADGRDMSWLWDVEFDTLRDGGVDQLTAPARTTWRCACSTTTSRSAPSIPRLRRRWQPSSAAAKDKPKRIFCTYTAMLAIRRELSKITTVEVVS